MTACGRDLERTPRETLSLDLRHILPRCDGAVIRLERRGGHGARSRAALEHVDRVRQRGQRADVEAGDGGGLKGPARRREQLQIVAASQESDREHPRDRADRPVERQFAHEEKIIIVTVLQQAAGRQYSDGDREVERGASLRYAGRCQVDGDSVSRKREPRVLDRASNSVATLSHARVGETDHRERWKAEGYVDLYRDERGRYAEEGSRLQASEHVRYPANHGPVGRCVRLRDEAQKSDSVIAVSASRP